MLAADVRTVLSCGVVYECGARTACFLYPTANAGTSKASQAFWQVEDIEREIAELEARGVTLEHYDLEGNVDTNGIITAGGARAAWFKDPEGNILAIIQDVDRKRGNDPVRTFPTASRRTMLAVNSVTERQTAKVASERSVRLTRRYRVHPRPRFDRFLEYLGGICRGARGPQDLDGRMMIEAGLRSRPQYVSRAAGAAIQQAIVCFPLCGFHRGEFGGIEGMPAFEAAGGVGCRVRVGHASGSCSDSSPKQSSTQECTHG
jgi:hypothetical protein